MSNTPRLVVHVDGPDGENVAVLLAPLAMLHDDAVLIAKEVLSSLPARDHDPDELVASLQKAGFEKVENSVVMW